MSRADLEAYVWQRLSARRWAVGRAAVDRVTRRVLRRWEREPNLKVIASSVEEQTRQDAQLGVIASWVLAALISEIVRAVWEWWRKSYANHCLIFGYQRELPDDDE